MNEQEISEILKRSQSSASFGYAFTHYSADVSALVRHIESMNLQNQELQNFINRARRLVYDGHVTEAVDLIVLASEKRIDEVKPVLYCDRCGKHKPDVKLRGDGYRQEIGGVEDAEWIACDDCNHENNMDI